MKNITTLINQYKFDKIKTIKFEISSITVKYKKVLYCTLKQLKKVNNLIISNYNNQLNCYLPEHIFNCYKEVNNCSPTYFDFVNLLKKHNANKFELQYSYEIYSYEMIKYISKTQDYTNFIQLLTKRTLIKKFQKEIKQLKTNTNNEEIGIISNGSISAVFAKNGCNFIIFNQHNITEFSYNLCKKNNISIVCDNKNLLQESSYYFYKNYIILTSNKALIKIKLCNNKIKFNIWLKQKGNIKFLIDILGEVKPYSNYFFIDNNNLLKAYNVAKIINGNNCVGFEFNSKNNYEIDLICADYIQTRITNNEFKQLNNELVQYYSCSNNTLSKKEILNISEFNLNFPIKQLKMLNYIGFPQCDNIFDINKKITVDSLNFNQKFKLPPNIYHLCSNGKIITSSDITINSQTLLLNKCNYLYLDIQTFNFAYSNTSKTIKIQNLIYNYCFYINSNNYITSAEKINNFLFIKFKTNKNNLIIISDNKQSIKTNNIYKQFLIFKRNAKNNLVLNLNHKFFNIDLLYSKIIKFNIFSQEFAIFYQKINKKCNFLPLFNAFKYKNEIINLFLNHTEWNKFYYNIVLDYIYLLQEYTFKKLIEENLNIIISKCNNIEIKNKLFDQIGQLDNTALDMIVSGNFEILKNIDDFYYCYLYLFYHNNLVHNKKLNENNKQLLLYFNQIILINNNEKIYYEIKSAKNKSVTLCDVNYIGFNNLYHNNKHIIYL